MATATKTARSFVLTCPFCGANEDNAMNLNLNDMTTLSCSGCDEEFSPLQAMEKAAKTLAAWEKVVRFVEMGRELAAE